LPVHSLAARTRRFLVAGDRSLPARMALWNSSFAADLDQLLRPEAVSAAALAAPAEWQSSFFSPGESTTLASILDHNFRTYLAYDLQTKLDRCSAGQALEVRSPFLDTALVEYAGRLPDRFRRRGTRTKHILRSAFSDLIPPEIARRPKRGFAVPLAAWFRGPLRPWLTDTLSPGARLHAWLRPERVRSLVDDHLSGRCDRSQQLWTLCTLETWLRSIAVSEARPARVGVA
jgi:asparagine synthase (glutamine-hydrolysing)